MTTTSLTPKREAFAREYVATGNASASYRAVYDTSRMAAHSVAVEASKLLSVPEVSLMVQSLRNELAARHNVTLDSLLMELETTRIRAMAGDKPQVSAAIQAIMAKAKLLGYLDRKPQGDAPDMARMVEVLINRLPG